MANVVEIVIKAKNEISKGINSATSSVKKFVGSVTTLQGAIGALGVTTAMYQLLDWAKEAIALSREQARVERQLEAVIKSTGGAAGKTADDVKNLASQLQGITNYGDEATISAANLLLTFKNIQGENFDRAVMSMQDMSSLLGQDLKSSAIQLGKALNDPVTGVSALQRVGVSFTEQQKEQIKTMADVGNIVGAQKIIFQELESQFGGAAQAAREADANVTAMGNALGDLQEVIGAQLTPTVAEFNKFVIDSANGWITAINAIADINKIEERAAQNLGFSLANLNAQFTRGTLTQEQWRQAQLDAARQLAAEEKSAKLAAAGMKAYDNATRLAAEAAKEAAAASRTDAAAKVAEAQAAQFAADAQRLASQRAKQAAEDNARAQAAQFASGDNVTGDAAYQQAVDLKANLAALDVGSAVSSSFDSAAQDLQNTISSVIQPSLSEVWQPDQQQGNVDEWARRLATVATSGLGSEWTTQLQQQFGGQDFFQPISDAIAAGDNAGAMEAAKELLTNNVTALYDKELIKQRVREKLQQEQLRDELIKEIQAELGAEGVAVSTGVIATAAGDASLAQDQVKTGLDNVGIAAQDMQTKATGAFAATAKSATDLETVLKRVKLITGGINGDLSAINQQGVIAGNNFGVLPKSGVGQTQQ